MLFNILRLIKPGTQSTGSETKLRGDAVEFVPIGQLIERHIRMEHWLREQVNSEWKPEFDYWSRGQNEWH